jgi:acetyl-CoA acetyltransferase family protein
MSLGAQAPSSALGRPTRNGRAVIVAGVRSPFVRAGGPLRSVPVPELGRLVVRELLYRADWPVEEVDELIAGNVAQPPDATNVARVVALKAGLPQDRIAHTVNRACASGFECATEAVEHIETGRARVVVALGVESLSRVPLLFPWQLTDKLWRFYRARSLWEKAKALVRFRPSDLRPVVGLRVGLTDPVSGLMMGETAEKLAREFAISRLEQDRYALQSHHRAVEAWQKGRLAPEVMPIYPEEPPEPVVQDVGPRPGLTLDRLAAMPPYFDRRYGTVTVGNSCQITDGAAALLLMDEETARRRGYHPLGRIVDYAYAGCDPARMGLGPVSATAKLLDRTGLTLGQIDLIELNEAFAAQVLACLKAFESDEFARQHLGRKTALGPLPMEKLNVNGGAIALGHPVGATGTRLILTLLYELRRRGQRLGLATLCVGGGQGGAVLVEAF